ncbi:MAG: ceramidase domain-containing protein, partial [Pseudomonadota bacterium]
MENLMRQVDGYCERLDFSYWAEPVNAVTNAAFLIAAVLMWGPSRGHPLARILCAVLFAIGVGSYLFHTHATIWASIADVAPIGIFILVYLFTVNLHVAGWPLWASLLGTLAFLPYAAAVTWLMDRVPFFEISNFYWSVPLLLLIYGVFLRQRFPQTVRGMWIGAAILCISITVRSIDMPLCETIPLGTHFLWHCLNGLMLG